MTDLIFTPQMKAELGEFLDNYGEDTFGHFPANLDFSPQAIPDRHYYQAQGQEPPTQPVKPDGVRSFRNMFCWVCFWLIVGELILLLWPGVL